MRPTYRPPSGFPQQRQGRWQGWIVSLLAHLFLLALLIGSAMRSDFDPGRAEGAGGKGPVGGGGGSPGGGVAEERLRFIQLAPAPADAAKLRVAPIPVPQVPSPVPPQVHAPAPPVTQTIPPPAVASPVPGTGSGAGAAAGSGAGGAGPGSGGGVGSGEGTGRGTGTGPGTGGGSAKNYPPTPKQFFLPPLPAPSGVRGFHMIAWFDVDSTGKSTLLRYTPTPDGGYNKRLRETLLALRFRPAVRPDGTPIRDTVNVEYTF